MTAFSLPLTKLVHENLSVVMCFCYSRLPLEDVVRTRFVGEWKYLNKALFEVSEARAARACLELALFLRLLDDGANLSSTLNHVGPINFGRLVRSGKPDSEMTLRDVCNKIIHAADVAWILAKDADPILVCISKEPEKWEKAEINVFEVATYAGELIS